MSMVDWPSLNIKRVPAPPPEERFASLNIGSAKNKVRGPGWCLCGTLPKLIEFIFLISAQIWTDLSAQVAEAKAEAKAARRNAEQKAREEKQQAKEQAKLKKEEARRLKKEAKNNKNSKGGPASLLPDLDVDKATDTGASPTLSTTPESTDGAAQEGDAADNDMTVSDAEAGGIRNGDEDTWARGLALHPKGRKGKLIITVVKATNLLNVDRLGKSDPMVTVRVEGHQRNSSVVKNNLSPVFDMTVSYMITDRETAIVECGVHDTDRGGGVGSPLGRVTFPLHVVQPGLQLTQAFVIEPEFGMKERAGELGELEISLLFMPSEVQPQPPAPIESMRLQAMFDVIADLGINVDALNLAREASNTLIARTVDELRYIQPPQAAANDLVALQREAFAEGDEADIMYNLDQDLAMEGKLVKPMRQKHRTAISFILSKIFDFNPAVLGVIESTISKFAPVPEVTGSFAAAVLGTIGMPEKALSGGLYCLMLLVHFQCLF